MKGPESPVVKKKKLVELCNQFPKVSTVEISYVSICMHVTPINILQDQELTHLKRPRYWERLRAGGEGDDRG